ncbi:MAG: MarR family EPS-associated transcriptional regulator [Castellaniella sp.]|uniref:MarR family EPS-associated transcriptional regulator n=1 Tax=Castellaniella sp. TaxID=1955812 RepID=UPI002A35A70C|nr:MarR family EPS-associated transcriptional regulator [Castellaniella sp.]MDY0310306.1 MarR family EPS-associated transcriptional regulator [Castellaniella sp.]
MTDVVYEEHHLKVLRLLEADPGLSQRDLSQALGISLGKTNYCMRALLDKGLIKMRNFRNNDNKLGYVYLLTPAGIAAKADLTRSFLKIKMREYELLRKEIEDLQRESETNESGVDCKP